MSSNITGSAGLLARRILYSRPYPHIHTEDEGIDYQLSQCTNKSLFHRVSFVGGLLLSLSIVGLVIEITPTINTDFTCSVDDDSPDAQSTFVFNNQEDLIAGHDWLDDKRQFIVMDFYAATLEEAPEAATGHCLIKTFKNSGLPEYFVIDAIPRSVTGRYDQLNPNW